jgi:hypothetical protein
LKGRVIPPKQELDVAFADEADAFIINGDGGLRDRPETDQGGNAD